MAVLALSNGSHVVVRRPNERVLSEEGGLEREYSQLMAISKIGLLAPNPQYVDNSGFFVMEFLTGMPEFVAPARPGVIAQYAEYLAKLHSTDVEQNQLTDIRRLKNPWTRQSDSLAEGLRETDVRQALEKSDPASHLRPEVLRHGDLWPGNMLWKGGSLIGVVDWENCSLGDPLLDLSICRLDVLWVYGPHAMQELTETYFSLSHFPREGLTHFDLVAALRPMHHVSEFATAYPEFGRPDITTQSLTEGLLWFIEQALSRV